MKYLSFFLLSCISSIAISGATIDPNVYELFERKQAPFSLTQKCVNKSLSLLLFLHSNAHTDKIMRALEKLEGVHAKILAFIPGIIITLPNKINLVHTIAKFNEIAQISTIEETEEELDISTQAILLTPSEIYPTINNWWEHGYTGEKGIIGLLDQGIDVTHPALAQKKFLIRTEIGSQYDHYLNGVSTPHATGVACIYASNDQKHQGVAYSAPIIISALAGAENATMSSLTLTLSSIDWMLNRAEIRPTIINYSMGNGLLSCKDCGDWSPLAKVIDYVVNHDKILWVKSAGNSGYVAPTSSFPFASTLTVPADNYNALTVANMNTVVSLAGITYKTSDRTLHHITETSSRGPTPYGRKKPDLTAPGNHTSTCAPDPNIYGFNYTQQMDYHDGYRFMGGTSSAAPHVGGAILLLQDAGITDPIAAKALLINSADTWTEHHSIMGSQWNRTYGWGYINLQQAWEQRENLVEDILTAEIPLKQYHITLNPGDKVTLVHERRVGYFKDNKPWKLSRLQLELIDEDNNSLLMQDGSVMDTVHQVSNCIRGIDLGLCKNSPKPLHALIQVKLLSAIDGSDEEPFALIASQKIFTTSRGK